MAATNVFVRSDGDWLMVGGRVGLTLLIEALLLLLLLSLGTAGPRGDKQRGLGAEDGRQLDRGAQTLPTGGKVEVAPGGTGAVTPGSDS